MPLAAGTQLGPYEIQSPIGAGGMGEVYRARDHRLERDVAVKVLPTHFTPGSRQLARFEREARLLASLNHSNICTVYDVGTDRGISFIVMEYLQGDTLAARIERGPISFHVAIRYALQILDALRTAHRAGLVHRDIKPSNIMLTTGGVKLLDFGLAKRRATDSDELQAVPAGSTTPTSVPTDLSLQDGIVGTLHYMAPEQLTGGAVDARSDIWAFGCVIYEMLTGKRLFVGNTFSDVVSAIMTDRPLVMSLERNAAPVALEHVLGRCLARNAADRWQTTDELWREFLSMLPQASPLDSSSGQAEPSSKSDVKPRIKSSGQLAPQRAPEPPPETDAREARPGSRRWVAFAGLGLAVLIAGLGGAWYFFGRALGGIPSLAVLPFVSSGGTADMAYVGQGLAEGVVAELARVPGVRLIGWDQALHEKATADPQSVGRSLGVDRIVTGRLVVRSGRLDVETRLVDVTTGKDVWTGRQSEPMTGLASLQREVIHGILAALGIEGKEQGHPLATIPTSIDSQTYELILKGRYALGSGTEGSLKAAAGFFTEATARDAHAAVAYTGLAESYNALAEPMMATLPPDDAFPKAKQASMQALEIDPSLADAHGSLGFAKMSYDWDWEGAGLEFQRAIELQPSNPLLHESRAAWLSYVGRLDDAMAEARSAVALDPRSASARVLLGWYLNLARRYDEALDEFKTAIALDANSAAAHWALGVAYDGARRPADALTELQSAARLSGNRPVYLAALGYGYGRSGQAADAKQVLARLHAAHEYVSPFDLALVAVGLDDRETAFKYLTQAVDDHASAVVSLGADPRLERLSADPRLPALQRRVGLTQDHQ